MAMLDMLIQLRQRCTHLRYSDRVSQQYANIICTGTASQCYDYVMSAGKFGRIGHLRPTSPLEGISDLFDQLPTKACEELTCRLLTSISSLPARLPASYPKNRYPLCGRIWQHALGGPTGVKPCALPAEIQNSKFEPVWVNTRTATQPKYQNSKLQCFGTSA
jgi:hypothetical protein